MKSRPATPPARCRPRALPTPRQRLLTRRVVIDEDTDYVFQTADFSFADANTGDILLNVKVATLPTAGYLLRDGAALTARAAVLPDDIDAGKFTFRPAPNGNGAPYASFTFQVSDGTAESTPANTISINVTPVNDPPTGELKFVRDPTNKWGGSRRRRSRMPME